LVNKRFSVAFLSLLLCLGVVYVVNSELVAAAGTFQVPSPAYPTIQSAIDAASPGDTIYVAPGIYNENIFMSDFAAAPDGVVHHIKDNLTLIGANRASFLNGVIAVSGRNLTIKGFTVNGTVTLGAAWVYPGLWTYNCTFVGNTVLSAMHDAGVSDRIISNKLTQLYLDGADPRWRPSAYKVRVEKNVITGGVTISRGAYQNTINSNLIVGASVGILENESARMYYYTGGNTISNNIIIKNRIGICIDCSSEDYGDPAYVFHKPDYIFNNVIASNGVGMEFCAADVLMVGNEVYHNEFVKNKIQVRAEDGIVNIWAINGRGNFWSDYRGRDMNRNGVGDTPYVINSDNKDDFPLMKPKLSILLSHFQHYLKMHKLSR